MRFSLREIILTWVTLAAILLGVTFWQGREKVEELKSIADQRATLVQRKQIADRLSEQRPEWVERLKSMQKDLPVHPLKKDVTAELLRMLEQKAKNSGLKLTRREPEKERHVGNLYEVAINCRWEGNLEALVNFLYNIHSQGSVLDVDEIRVTPVSGAPDKLKGTFTLDCAYNRADS